MNTLDRPLFRQMGGPAQMTPEETMMAVGEAEAAGAQIGQEYLEGTMQSLDQAESPKDVIDAIRGNEQPLEARYQELATFVGEEDARQTPETVLALVQPTIMMTEEGAMDTGIAQLMQQMVGDVDMGGTDMGQGVGSLMMAGASEAPAPQNFNQGGAVNFYNGKPVVKLADAGDASAALNARIQGINTLMESFGSLAKPPSAETVKGYYESLLPLYQEIIGESEEDKRMRQGATFFDIAQAGLNLAAGVDPRTGRSTAGMPFASQLAAAASQLPQQLNTRAAEQRAAERALNATALQTAMQQAQGEQGFRQTVGTALAKDILDPTKFSSEKALVVKGGKVEAFNIDTPDGFTDYQTALQQGAVPYEKPTGEGDAAPFELFNKDGKSIFIDKNLGSTEFAAELAAAEKAGFTLSEKPDLSPYGSKAADKARARSVQEGFEQKLYENLFLGNQTPENRLAVDDLLLMLQPVEGSTTPGKVRPELQIYAALAQPGAENIRAEVQQALPVDPQNTQQSLGNMQETIKQANEVVKDIMLGKRSSGEVSKDIELLINDLTNTELETATGLPSMVTNVVEGVAQQFADIVGSPIQTKIATDTKEGRRLLETFETMGVRYFAQEQKDRFLAIEFDKLLERFPDPLASENDADAMKRIENLGALFRAGEAQYRNILQNPSLATGTTLDNARKRLRQSQLLAELSEAMVRNYRYGPSGMYVADDPSGSSDFNSRMSQYFTGPKPLVLRSAGN